MTGVEWTGIGHYNHSGQVANKVQMPLNNFLGIYDGKGNTIKNITVAKDGTQATYLGAFISWMDNNNNAADPKPGISNLTVNVIGAGDGVQGFAAFVGVAKGVNFENCKATGTFSGSHSMGGFCVQCYGDSLFKDCVNEATITSTASKKVGGFIGQIQGPGKITGVQFVNCVNKGDVTAPGSDVGGIIGLHSANPGELVTFESCSNEGAVEDPNGVARGQLVGSGNTNNKHAITGINTVNPDALALGNASGDSYDGFCFATVAGDPAVATLISTNDFVKGNTYKVMAGGVAGQVFELAAENDTISFNLELVNDACTFTVGAAAGLKAEKGDVTDHVVTFTAVPDAIFPPSPKEEDIPTILSKATDTKLAANITSADDYAAFQTWATTIGQADVATSAYAWYSFALDQSALLTAEPEIDVDEVEVTSDGAFVLTVSVEDLTLGANALVKAFGAQGTDELGNVDKPFASANVTVDPATAKIENGKAVLTVTPAEKYATPAAFFFKAELK